MNARPQCFQAIMITIRCFLLGLLIVFSHSARCEPASPDSGEFPPPSPRIHWNVFSVFNERTDSERAYGIDSEVIGKTGLNYAGLSFSGIKSNENALSWDNRKEIYTFYLFGGIRIPRTVSPYFSPYAEFGIDLVDLLLDGYTRKENAPRETDFSYAIGIDLVTDQFRIALYQKWYRLYYLEPGNTVVNTNFFVVNGIRLSYNLE